MTQVFRSKQSKMDNYHRVRNILGTFIFIEIFYLVTIIYNYYKFKEHDANEIMIFYADIVQQIVYIFLFTHLYVLVGRIV